MKELRRPACDGVVLDRPPESQHGIAVEDNRHAPQKKRPARGREPRTNTRDGRTKGDLQQAILAIDIGGTSVKALASGQHNPLKFASGKDMTPARMVEAVIAAAKPWKFDAVSIGYPGLVGAHGPRSEPLNLGSGWVGFDFAAAFGKPVKMITIIRR